VSPAGPSTRPARAVTIFAVALLVAGPPLDYLHYRHYPLLSLEVALPVVLWLACAIGIGYLLNRASRPARIIAFAFLLLVFFDLQFSHNVHLRFVLLFAGLLAVVWLLERHVETILAVSLAAFYLAGVPVSSRIKASRQDFSGMARDTMLPPVVYLIVDEHIGIEGWPAEFAETRDMQREVRQLYLDEGFRVFGRAYSEYNWTRFAIPAALNWKVPDPRTAEAEIVPGSEYALTANDLFQTLSERGYQIRVYQSSFLDFCDPDVYAIRSCRTHLGNSIRDIAVLDVALWTKVALLGMYYLEHDSPYYERARQIYSGIAGRHGGPRWELHNNWYAFPAAMDLLDSLREDLRANDSRGTLYFAHLLAPHGSYVVDATCRPWTFPGLERGGRAADQGRRTPAARAQLYTFYTAQVGCLNRHLAALFHVVDSTPALRRTVIVVHGDHGSRIALHNLRPGNLLLLQPSDLSDALFALFAIRAPGIPAGYDRRFVTLSELVGGAVESGFTRIDAPDFKPHVLKVWRGPHMPFATLTISDTALMLDPHAEAAVKNGRSR